MGSKKTTSNEVVHSACVVDSSLCSLSSKIRSLESSFNTSARKPLLSRSFLRSWTLLPRKGPISSSILNSQSLEDDSSQNYFS